MKTSTTAELPQRQVPDHEVQELLGMLEEETREIDRAEKEDQETREVVVRGGNMLADLLSGAISRLDKLKGQKQ